MTQRISAHLLALAFACACACRGKTELPEAQYREVVQAFYTGIAALQTSQEVLARQKLERVTQIAPDEPAGWANLGLLLMRQQETDTAALKLAKAAELAPRSAPIQRLLALAESRRGKLAEAIAHWKRALELDPADLQGGLRARPGDRAPGWARERSRGAARPRDAPRAVRQPRGSTRLRAPLRQAR